MATTSGSSSWTPDTAAQLRADDGLAWRLGFEPLAFGIACPCVGTGGVPAASDPPGGRMQPDDTNAGLMMRKRFLRHPRQVAQARAFVAGGLAGGSELQETARLLVSETVTSTLAQSPAGREVAPSRSATPWWRTDSMRRCLTTRGPLGCGAASTAWTRRGAGGCSCWESWRVAGGCGRVRPGGPSGLSWTHERARGDGDHRLETELAS